MTAGFDAQRYLRLLGERVVLSGEGRHMGPFGDSAVGDAARALVAVGAVAPEVAQAVVDDYRLAASVRAPGPITHRLLRASRHPGPPAAGDLAGERRLARCRGTIEQPSGTLRCRYAILTAGGTWIGATWRSAGSTTTRRRHGRRFFGGGPGHGPGSITVADDHGTSVSCVFNGSGDELEMRGRIESDDPLSLDTAWLEVDGTRLYLEAGPPPRASRVEPAPDLDPAHRYLWHTLAAAHPWRPQSDLTVPIDALTAAGALAADDPVMDGVRYVAERRNGPVGRPPPPRARAGGPGGSRGSGVPASVPPEWRSVLGGARSPFGRERSMAIAADLPELDGRRVTVGDLQADRDGFTLDVLVESDRHANPLAAFGVDDHPLVWWAADDRGSWHLGELGGWGGGGGRSLASVNFHPPLHPRAAELRVIVDALRERAMIAVALEWDEEP